MERYFQWITTHKWMTDYTPQTEWIERRGILVWLAEVFTSLGSGLYLISLFLFSFDGHNMSYLLGMIVGWIIIMFLKIPLHLAYFGKPLRFWRTVPPFTSGFKTSWFCRGITFNILFTGFAVIQLAITFFFPGTPVDILFKVITGIFAFLVW